VPTPATTPARIRLSRPEPLVDCGRHAVKRTVDDQVEVRVDVLRDGHEQVRAALLHQGPGESGWHESPMAAVAPDRWGGSIRMDVPGLHRLDVEAWVDRFASWREELRRKREAGQASLASELAEGAALVAEERKGLKGDARTLARKAAKAIGDGSATEDERCDAALTPELATALAGTSRRAEAARLEAPLLVDVDVPLARFSTWYELFPRSFGGFAGVESQLPRLAELGVDVLYLTPIHPIGTTHRKGRNNSETAEPGEPGSPWAIGAPEGGHTAVHPELGTLDDFARLVRAARGHDIEIALDIAIQCSPDHPWLTEHPEWFHHRPDGTLKYAENPPKRYQDIYNVNFDCEDWRALWEALRDVFAFWIERGVRVFRVDNPHTKPIAFWEWCIADLRAGAPDAVFLAEAFTRPAMMSQLAKVGFSQSYTYFTWKNSKADLVEFVDQLEGWSDVLRPNLFANTPDILHAYLQHGGPPAFETRLVLAATISPAYGIYSGYEHFERVPVREGSEEYLDSEKYETKRRALDGPLLALYGRLNTIRRAHAPLQRLGPLRFLETHNDQLIAYVKGRGAGAILVCACLDPHASHEGLVEVPGDLDLPGTFRATDLLGGGEHTWHVGGNYVSLGPDRGMAHVMELQP
jgi:starch synthase (maltosyl-transferring)